MKTAGAALALGTAIGVGIGVAIGNLGLGIAIGIALGAAVGVSRRKEAAIPGAEEGDGAAVRLPPPLCFVAAIAAGVGLHSAWPLSLGLTRTPRVGLAVLVALVAVPFLVGALKLFRQTDQDPRPWLATPEIITGGVYRWTRNPMYLALALGQAAIGIGLGNLWIVLLVPVACAAVQFTAIRPEEAYLEAKFGEPYRAYKGSVRRWI